MIEKHCIVPMCNLYPCWGNGKAWACGAHKHIIGFGGANEPAKPAEERPGSDGRMAIAPPRPHVTAAPGQGRLL